MLAARRLSRPSESIPERFSPSILGGREEEDDAQEEEEEPDSHGGQEFAATAPVARSAGGGSSGSGGRAPGRTQSPAPVPETPPTSSTGSYLLDNEPGIGADEMYGADERQLNQFLIPHPMLSMDATGQRHLQLVANMFDKATVPSIAL